VNDGIRTHDRLDHNQELYQLSYVHQETGRRPVRGSVPRASAGALPAPLRRPPSGPSASPGDPATIVWAKMPP
jgi:hypothetical protein